MPELMELSRQLAQQQAALVRVEEQLKYVVKALENIQQSERETASRREVFEQRLARIELRLDNIEGKGLAAWSAKRIVQLAAIMAAVGTIFALTYKAAIWFFDHWPR